MDFKLKNRYDIFCGINQRPLFLLLYMAVRFGGVYQRTMIKHVKYMTRFIFGKNQKYTAFCVVKTSGKR